MVNPTDTAVERRRRRRNTEQEEGEEEEEEEKGEEDNSPVSPSLWVQLQCFLILSFYLYQTDKPILSTVTSHYPSSMAYRWNKNIGQDNLSTPLPLNIQAT